MKRAFIIPVMLMAFVLFAGLAFAEEITCQMCHPDKAEGKSVHPAVLMGCTACHGGVDPSEIPHKFSGPAPRGLMAEPPELCFFCHDRSKFSGMKNVHMPVQAGMCTTCHSPHASDNNKMLVADPVCFMCHNQDDFMSKKTVHPPVGAGLCTNCHNPHQSDVDKLLVAQPPDLCYNCHNKMKFYAPNVHSPVSLGLCTSCHLPHQSDTKKLTVASGSKLCFMCHDESEFKKKGSVHKPVAEGRCLFCHRPHAGPNENLVYRKGNILCRRCHSNIERGLHVVSGFSSSGHPTRGRRDPNRPGKTFGCLSCHVPHSSDSPRLYRFQAENMFNLCQYCHDV